MFGAAVLFGSSPHDSFSYAFLRIAIRRTDFRYAAPAVRSSPLPRSSSETATFTSPKRQTTDNVHYNIMCFLGSRPRPLPATWPDLSEMLQPFDSDVEDLRRLASSVQHPIALDRRVCDACIAVFRDATPMVVPRAVTHGINLVRQELNRQLLRAPGQQRGGRGRAGG